MIKPALKDTKDIPAKRPYVDSVESLDSRPESMRDGTEGFAPQYSGNGIEGKSQTSSFDVESGEPGRPTRVGGTGVIK